MDDICRKLGIHRIAIAPIHPESNGICERVIGTVKLQLEKADDLYQSCYNYNHSIYAATNRTPISLLFGVWEKMPEADPDREAELRTSRNESVEATIKARECNKKVVDQRQSTSKNCKVNDVVEIQIGDHDNLR